MTTTTPQPTPHQRQVDVRTPSAQTRPWWADVLSGHAKAVFGFLATLCSTLGTTLVDGHISLPEVLIAVGAALGVGSGVSQIPNSGPRAPGKAATASGR